MRLPQPWYDSRHRTIKASSKALKHTTKEIRKIKLHRPIGKVHGRPMVVEVHPSAVATVLVKLEIRNDAKRAKEMLMGSMKLTHGVLPELRIADARGLDPRLMKIETELANCLARPLQVNNSFPKRIDLMAPFPPARRRISITDSTVEMLHVLLRDNPAGIAVIRDELTDLFAGRERPGHKPDRAAFFLEVWNGDSPDVVTP